MPYNNTPIYAADDIAGGTHLPMSRVKKVLSVDDDINQVSNQAVFVSTKACELFIRHIAAKSFQAGAATAGSGGGGSKKPSKRSLAYADVARVVHRLDELEFLTDAVPEPVSYGRHRAQRRREEEAGRARKVARGSLEKGQGTLVVEAVKGGVGSGRPDAASEEPKRITVDAMLNDPEPEVKTQMLTREEDTPLQFRHYEPQAAEVEGRTQHVGTDRDADVDMS